MKLRKKSKRKVFQRGLSPATGKCIWGCFTKPVVIISNCHECFLIALLGVAYFLLKYASRISLAAILGNNPLSDPLIILEPYMFLLFALLLVQKFWKNGTLGFVLAISICMATLCFMAVMVAMMTADPQSMFEYLVILLLPISMFAISVSMGRKYQHCINC